MKTKAYDLKQNKFGSGCMSELQPEATLMCPKCYDLIRIEQTGKILATNKDETEYIDLLVTPRYHCECPTCHTQGEFIPIDSLIAEAVSKLNKAGYITEQCCNTHGEESLRNFFIKFRQEYRFESLPVGFKQEGLFIRPTDVHTHRYMAVESLNDWVRKFEKSRAASLLQAAIGD